MVLAFSSCGEGAYSVAAIHVLLITVASLVEEHRFQGRRASIVAASSSVFLLVHVSTVKCSDLEQPKIFIVMI